MKEYKISEELLRGLRTNTRYCLRQNALNPVSDGIYANELEQIDRILNAPEPEKPKPENEATTYRVLQKMTLADGGEKWAELSRFYDKAEALTAYGAYRDVVPDVVLIKYIETQIF